MDGILTGHVVLIVEDEPVIAWDLMVTFEEQGAKAILAQTISSAMIALEEPFVSVAIVDHWLGDGNSNCVCKRLVDRKIPFLSYTGDRSSDGPCQHFERVLKPAEPSLLVAKVKSLLDFHGR